MKNCEKSLDKRNIVDKYKYWNHDAIIADLDLSRNNFSVLCTNIIGDFNIGTVIRNANAFLASEVIIYGSRRYDRRGTVGTHLYTKFKHVRIGSEEEIKKLKKNGVTIIGVDNIPRAKTIENYDWQLDSHIILVFGEESCGISDEVKEMCDDFVYITQYGSVRSLNVGTASGIAMYELCKRINSRRT